MSFFENPKIDAASERSEESVNATRIFFTQKAGFIIREEKPDYGVDFDVELIENKEATRNKFAIQIKSSSKFNSKILKQEEYFILDFLTSRLGYLSRNTPGLGLIVIYDESRKQLYYDYIEEIIDRITVFKESTDWISQEKVRIYIPAKNTLNQNSIKSLYGKFQQVFKNHNTLLLNHARDYNIPIVDATNSLQEIKIDSLLKMLEEYGLFLFNNLKFSELFAAFSKIPYSEISRDPKLSFLAALVYSEIGKPIDSNLFLQYCELHKNNLSEEFIDIISFTRFRNDFILGKRDIDKFIEELVILEKRSKSKQNSFTIRINISLLKLYNIIGEKEIDDSLLLEFKNILTEITNAELNKDITHLLILFQLENYYTCALKLSSQSIIQQKLKESLGVFIPRDERIRGAKYLFELLSFPIEYIKKAMIYAEESKNKLIRAHSLHKMAAFVFTYLFDNAMLNIDLPETINSVQELLETCFDNSILSYNLFINLKLINEAHIALIVAYETKQLSILQYNRDIGKISSKDILDKIRKLENDIGKQRFSSVIEKFYSEKENMKKSLLKDLSIEEIVFFAKSIARARNLPESRFENLLQDIKNRQLFEKYCDIEKYELLQTNGSGEDIYKFPTSYILINKANNLALGNGINLRKMLIDLGFIKNSL
jgi:hypothetical protein